MPATIFAGTRVKALKSTLNLNGGADIISSSVDPTSSTTEGEPGSLLLNTTSGKLYRKNDSGSSTNWSEVGSGGSGINYVTNPSAATNTTGWSTYADAAGTQPVDGTGGSPTVTWTRSTTTPLRGAGDFNFTKDAANRQGEGVATDITIDLADQAKVLTVSFDYEVLSGTYATGDLTVYLIADPSGTPVVIQPAGYQIQSGTAGTKLKQIATFQTQATGQSYRVCFHVASTSASAYSLAVDNVVVGPQTVQYGAPVTDWVSYTPSIAGLGTGTTTGGAFYYRRVGDSLFINGRWTMSAAGSGATQVTVSLPPGLSVDSAKFTNNESIGLGAGNRLSGATRYPLTVTSGASAVSNSLSFVDSNAGFITGASLGINNQVGFEAFVPILGWSSTVQMSNDTDTRVVAARYTSTSTAAVPNSPTVFDFATKAYDTHNAVTTGANWRFTAPVPGYYRYSVKINLQNGGVATRNDTYPRVDGSAYVDSYLTLTTASQVDSHYSEGCVYLNAGSYLDFQNSETVNSASYITGSTVSIERLSGPSAIAATETVAATYRTNSAQTIPNNIDSVVLNPSTKEFDTHGMFVAGSGYNSVTGTWTVAPGIIVPVSGKYAVSWSAPIALPGSTAYEIFSNVNFSRNGVSQEVTQGGRYMGTSTVSGGVLVSTGSTVFNCLAGDKISLAIFQNSGASRGTGTDGRETKLSVVRVGN